MGGGVEVGARKTVFEVEGDGKRWSQERGDRDGIRGAGEGGAGKSAKRLDQKQGWKNHKRTFTMLILSLPKLFDNKQLIYFTTDFGFLAIPVYTREYLPNKEHPRLQIVFK